MSRDSSWPQRPDPLRLHEPAAPEFDTRAYVELGVMVKLFATADVAALLERQARACAKTEGRQLALRVVAKVLSVLDRTVDASPSGGSRPLDRYLEIRAVALAGEDLEARVLRAGPLTFGEVAMLVPRLAAAVATAANASIKLPSLAPRGLFVVEAASRSVVGGDGDLDVELLNYSAAGEVPASGAVFGRLAAEPDDLGLYLSPEQREKRSRDASERCLVWSLGLLVFFALTGQVFWRALDQQRLEIEIREAAIPPASEQARVLGLGAPVLPFPPGFDDWFRRCVNRDAAKRFRSVGEAAAAFETLHTRPRAEPPRQDTSRRPEAADPAGGWRGPAPSAASPNRDEASAHGTPDDTIRTPVVQPPPPRVEQPSAAAVEKTPPPKLPTVPASAALSTAPPTPTPVLGLAAAELRSLKSLRGHTRPIRGLCFEGSGTTLYSASADKSVLCWDVERGVTTGAFRDHPGAVVAVTYDDAKRRLFAASGDGVVVWDTARAAREAFLQSPPATELTSISLASEARLIAAGCATGEILIFNADGLQLCRALVPPAGTKDARRRRITAVSFIGGGATLCATNDRGQLSVWDSERGELIEEHGTRAGQVGSLAVVDSHEVALAGQEARILLANVHTGHARAFDQHEHPVTVVAADIARRSVLSGDDSGRVLLWNADTLGLVARLADATMIVQAASLSRAGGYVAAGGTAKTVWLWRPGG